ncbi:MAG: hypothetical protein RR461_02490 [Angelakisella sp.]
MKQSCNASKADGLIEKVIIEHPHAAFLAVFIGIPLFLLFAVALVTAAVMLPTAWLCGWI